LEEPKYLDTLHNVPKCYVRKAVLAILIFFTYINKLNMEEWYHHNIYKKSNNIINSKERKMRRPTQKIVIATKLPSKLLVRQNVISENMMEMSSFTYILLVFGTTFINHKDFVTQIETHNNEMNLIQSPWRMRSSLTRGNFSVMLYYVYTISLLTKYDPHNDNIATSCDEQYHCKYQRPEELLPPWQIEWSFLINEDAVINSRRNSPEILFDRSSKAQTIKDTMVLKSLSPTVTNDVYHVTSENLTIYIRIFIES
ncbi:hypothetical protein ALC53_01338, partial [Atta colombica]